jgi:hypothetical protein
MPDDPSPDLAAPARPPAPGASRRVTVRYPVPEGVACPLASVEWSGPRWATVLDVARGGVGLLLDAPLGAGVRVLIGLPAVGPQPRSALAAEVVHGADLGDGTWAVGCAFDEPLSAVERESLLEGTSARGNGDAPFLDLRKLEALAYACNGRGQGLPQRSVG